MDMYKDLMFPTSSSTLLGYTQVRLREKVTRNRIRMAMPTPPAPMSCSYVATSPGMLCVLAHHFSRLVVSHEYEP